MTDAVNLLQITFDNLLAAEKIYTHWIRKSKIQGENQNEYIVFTVSDDQSDFWGDDHAISRACNIAVRYYFSESMKESPEGRKSMLDRIDCVMSALCEAGFSILYGPGNLGDIEDNGYIAILLECSYRRVVA